MERSAAGRPLPAAQPALLLPVRIETRFEAGPQAELWVRVFPDQIAVDSHDPRLTDAEVDAGRRYWDAIWRAGAGDADTARRAWRSLAQRFGATRAAYLVHAPTLTPTNLAARPAAPTPAGSAPVPPPDFPALTPGDRRPASWARAPRARGLPDRWTVTLIRGGVVQHRVTGAPIAADLAVGPDPTNAPAPTPDGLAVDDGILWMVDFDAAVAAGMAVRIPLTPADLRAGFDRVLVHGLATSAAGAGPALVQALLDVHRFTDGFALVPQGAPTNNTSDAPAGYARADPGFERSYRLEVAQPPAPRDGGVLADFLGLPAESITRAEFADRDDQGDARQMAVALWPATLGYFLEQMLPEVLGPGGREAARTHALGSVRSRGHVPAIRAGQTPYGILAATSLRLLASRRPDPVRAALADLLRRLLPAWERSFDAAPHVQRDGDHDAQLVGILGMDASSRAYRARHALGEELIQAAQAWLDVGAERESDFVTAPGKAELAKLGYGGWDPRLVHLALTTVDRDVPFPIVDDRPVSETEGLPPVVLPDGSTGNYISWLRAAPLAAIRGDDEAFPGGALPDTLLYKVLRHALLTEFGRSGWIVLADAGLAQATFARERELVGFQRDVRAGRPTVWQALDRELPEAEGMPAATVGERVALLARLRVPDHRHLWELLDALDALAGLPTAELERLFTETIDSCSHRIDPWIGSLAAALDRERRGDGARAYHLGAYGWVEDLRPRPLPRPVQGAAAERVAQVDALRRARAPQAPEPRPTQMPSEDNAGFIHAPSLAQATAGAVLRNGYLTHRDSTNGELLAVDLSSHRTRIALDLLEGIRQGQPLSALLGYRFERGLNAAALQVLIQPLRDRFPLVANRLTEPAAPAEAAAAANVVDGLAIHAAWKAGKLWDVSTTDDGGQRATVEGLVRDLDDAHDALGDLSITESVFQIMRGNPGRAGGMIDAISRGERPPDPEIVRTPRGGIDLTHRLVLLFSPGPARAAGWPGAGAPRAAVEPRLDAWVSTLLPHPAHVRCRVHYRRPGLPDGELGVTFAELGLGPLDAVALAAPGAATPTTEVEQRVLYHAQAVVPADAFDLRLVFERAASWGTSDCSFPEMLTGARSVHALLGGSRALTPQDLLEPERRALDHGAALDDVELDGRASGALARLGAEITALETATTATQLRSALAAASLYGVPGGVPGSATGADPATVAALQGQATALAAALRKRLTAAQDADAAFDRPSATPEQLRDHLTALLQTVLGADFAVCPRFTPAVAGELGAAFSASSSLLGGDPDAPERWLAQAIHVRAGASRWEQVRSGAQLLARRVPPAAAIAQLPRADPDRWLALPLDPGRPLPASGHVSIVAEVHPSHQPGQPHCGLVVDEWPERIPAAEQSTGLAFHFDQPNARAPQALLMAVCPDERPAWDDEALEAILEETLDLAKARAVDLESLGELGQLLPMLLFPFNADGEAVSLEVEYIR